MYAPFVCKLRRSRIRVIESHGFEQAGREQRVGQRPRGVSSRAKTDAVVRVAANPWRDAMMEAFGIVISLTKWEDVAGNHCAPGEPTRRSGSTFVAFVFDKQTDEAIVNRPARPEVGLHHILI